MKLSLERQTESERGINKNLHAKNQMETTINTVAELFKSVFSRAKKTLYGSSHLHLHRIFQHIL